jgi:hypothetical protein
MPIPGWQAARIVLETEGLGPRRFHGMVVLPVNRDTASAAGTIVAGARE